MISHKKLNAVGCKKHLNEKSPYNSLCPPPHNSIGGQRPSSWFKFLKEFEWEPIIVTRHWDENTQSPVGYVKPSENEKFQNERNNIDFVSKTYDS